MKRLGLTLVICVLLLQTGCRQQAEVVGGSESMREVSKSAVDATKAGSVDEKGMPEITFESTTHDFGEVGPNIHKVCEFKFKNTGDGILKIGEIHSTCGCTVPELAKKEYAPGESGAIQVKYNSEKRSGSVKRYLYVPSNDKIMPKVTLTIKADIVMKIDYEPETLRLLYEGANPVCPKITIASRDGKPFSITKFKATADVLTVDYDPAEESTIFVLEPKVNGEQLQLMYRKPQGVVNIGLTHPECDSISIPFNAMLRYKISPPSIVILDGKPLNPIKKEVWVLNNYSEDFAIKSTSSKRGHMKALSQEKVGDRYKIEVEIMPPKLPGRRKIFTDIFYVDIDTGEQLQVTCRGFYPMEQEQEQEDANDSP